MIGKSWKRSSWLMAAECIAILGVLFFICSKKGTGAIVKHKIADAPSEKTRLRIRLACADLSPDGRTIALTDDKGVWLISLETKHKELLVHGRYLVPRWSPEGKKLALVKPQDGNDTLVVVNIRDKKIQPIGERVSVTGRSISWSPDGKQIVWIQEGKPNRLVVSPVDRVGISCVVEGLNHVFPREVQWSPDGKYLAFAATRRAGWIDEKKKIERIEPIIGLIEPSGKGLKILLSAKDTGRESIPVVAFPRYISWSPDGSRIGVIFASGISVIHRNGTSKKIIYGEVPHPYTVIHGYVPQGSSELCWHFGSNSLLFVAPTSRRGAPPGGYTAPFELHWISANGKEHKVLLEEEEQIRDIRWLKDSEIVYLSGETLWLVRW